MSGTWPQPELMSLSPEGRAAPAGWVGWCYTVVQAQWKGTAVTAASAL